MKTVLQKSRLALAMAMAIAGTFAGSAEVASAADGMVALTGGHEVPPVTTSATGSGRLIINTDKTVSGSVTTSGVDATMAHIHEAAAGKNGPVIVPLEKKGANEWAVPAGAKLTDAQYKSYQHGNLYVNVHSAAYPGGEIRAQLAP